MNRLAAETSPYLRQHADNPVDWYPWGDEAFATARERDVPILLSVGYSACHWCHVMAHESFEDPSTAAAMNAAFVNVKVDREERPDVDAVYMAAVQAMTGQGGWPMTVFLDADGQPFRAGTYFPPEERHGMPAFRAVLDAVSQAWTERRAELVTQGSKVRDAVARMTTLDGVPTADALPPVSVLDGIVAKLAASFDARWGGFGRAPKFPPSMTIELLLRQHVRTGDSNALHMATHTLDHMAAGGMYDQLGGGFHRYSVDAFWLVPHFEKMLYDQSLLVRVYTHAFLVTGLDRYRRVVEETVGYVLRELRHAEGGFLSAEDADSEGVEGKFYVWSEAELRAVAGDDADEVVRYYGVTEGGNFEGENILRVVDPTEDPPTAVQRARPRLFVHRDGRVRPGLDDKVLLAWNGLFVRALAEAAAALDRADWMDAARDAAQFCLREMRDADGRLLRSWQDGRARHRAYAEDYAALLEALITLAELDGIDDWLPIARSVADAMIETFRDPEGGGLFTTGNDAETLLVRAKDVQDNALPSENSLAASGLLRLATLTGDATYEAPALEILRLVMPTALEYPTGFAHALDAFERAVTPPIEVAVVGPPDDPRTTALWRMLVTRLLPDAVVAHGTGQGAHVPTPLLDDRPLIGGAPAAYVCERYACQAPVDDADALGAALDAALEARR